MLPFRIAIALVVLVSPAAAWERPEEVAGAWRLGPSGVAAGALCELELLAAIAYEFEGIWYIARPLHYEENRAACRSLGVDDIIAWSGIPDRSLWLLAEGEAGFMEFTPGEGGWQLAKSDHRARPDLVLAKVAGDN